MTDDGTYTDPAHGVTYVLDDDGWAAMTCSTCGEQFYGQPADTESDDAPYDHTGQPYCGCREEVYTGYVWRGAETKGGDQ